MRMGKIEDPETRKMVVESGQAALKALLIINAGATVSFLTFIGTAIEHKIVSSTALPSLLKALQYFIGAVICTVLAYGLIYMTNICSAYSERAILRVPIGLVSNILAAFTIAAGLTAWILFIWGSFRALVAFNMSGTALQ